MTIRQQDHVFISGICEQAENGERIEAASRRRPGPASQRHLATRLRQCGNEERLAESSHGSSGTRPAGGPGPAGAQQSCKQTFAKLYTTRTFSMLKAATTAVTLKNLLRHNAKLVLTHSK